MKKLIKIWLVIVGLSFNYLNASEEMSLTNNKYSIKARFAINEENPNLDFELRDLKFWEIKNPYLNKYSGKIVAFNNTEDAILAGAKFNINNKFALGEIVIIEPEENKKWIYGMISDISRALEQSYLVQTHADDFGQYYSADKIGKFSKNE